MVHKGNVHSGTMVQTISGRETAHGRLAREAAAEGMVLLKNEGLLPLEISAPIALFGGGADQTVKGGIGSGDVNNRENISIYRGLREAGVSVTSEDWIRDYGKRYEAARLTWKEKVLADAEKVENPFDAYAANPFSLPEGREITAEDFRDASAAVYVVSRISGEGRDRRLTEGDYYLSRKEREDLCRLDRANIPIVLVLNTGAPVELAELLDSTENIRAVLYISLPGQEGGHAVADVLLGQASPGGRLAATWARHYEDYPSAKSFGYLNGDLEKEEYREGIYVGYRYFDSFGIQPLFPFGYGLTYTDFSMKYEGLRITREGIETDVTVENTGKHFPGREVVQVYVALPRTGLEKEYHRLAGFAKTEVLQPGETQRVTVAVEQKQLASFSELQQAWIIEEGNYGLWIGNSSTSLELAAVLAVSGQAVLERTSAICAETAEHAVPGASEFAAEHAALEPPGTASEHTAPEAAGPAVNYAVLDAPGDPAEFTASGQSGTAKTGAEQWSAMGEESGIAKVRFAPWEEERQTSSAPLAAEQPVEELIPLLYGNITEGTSTLGSAGIRVPGSAGETTEALEGKYGKRSLIMADGPAGLRLRQSYEVDRQTDTVYGVGVLGSLENGFLEEDIRHEEADVYYQYCTAFPVGTALAQTWDVGLMKRFGEAIAAEMEEFHVDLWLAPGMNIQRNPLCGRNFEYYSEDPLLSGMMAAAVTEGVQEDGRHGVTIKHFACNNQEDNRMGVDVRVSQRALREIYLRGFEIAVKKSAPVAIMTAYNCINGVHAANSRDLCTVVARGEWGFAGVIMSDWNTTVPADGSVPWKCGAAGNDIIMPGTPDDAENIRKAYAGGQLSEEAVRNCAGRILALIEKLTI